MSERYPCHYSSIALMSGMAALQATVYGLCTERDWNQWKLGWNIRLLASSFTVYIYFYGILCLISIYPALSMQIQTLKIKYLDDHLLISDICRFVRVAGYCSFRAYGNYDCMVCALERSFICLQLQPSIDCCSCHHGVFITGRKVTSWKVYIYIYHNP